MRTLMKIGLSLALSLGALAQVSSNGPVIADYGKQITASDPVEAKIAKEVRHELLMLPWYSLFDDLEFSVQGRTVTLSGALTSEHAVTKSDAENVVKRIEGVDKVINEIKILPPSPLDTKVREQMYEKLSRTGSLSRYFWEAAPSIHIIVENGRVTLTGVVLSQVDKLLAQSLATGRGEMAVTNALKTEM